MTIQTKRRVLLAAIIVALTVPAEVVLLRALQDEGTAAREWAATRSDDEIAGAGAKIQAYPFAYRQQIMARLPAEARAAIWRGHVDQYLRQHPEFDTDTADAIGAARGLITPALLSAPADDERDAAAAAIERVERLIGPDDARVLFYYLGPREATFASAAPVIDRLATLVRNRVVLLARESDCGCASSWGCGGYSQICLTDGVDCRMVVTWPMCGWLWSDPCDGMCGLW